VRPSPGPPGSIPSARSKPPFPLLLLAGAAAAVAACSETRGGSPPLCELAEAREDHAGRTLTIEGYLLVGRHVSVVTEPRCGLGIAIVWFDDDAAAMPEFARVATESQEGDVMARVRVTGRTVQERGPGFAGERAWQLELSAAEVLNAQRIPDADRERYVRWLSGPSPEPFVPSR
jgi:hypothetical protein